MDHRIQRILEDIKEKLAQKKELVSFTLAGSFSDDEKELEKTSDMDLLIIYEKVDEQNYAELRKDFAEICEKYSTDDFKVIADTRVGPIKLVPENGETTLLLEMMLFEKDTFVKKYTKNSPLSSYSLSKYDALLGKNIRDLVDVKKPDKEAVINGTSGINWCKNMIAKREAYIISWEKDGKFKNAFKREPLELTPGHFNEIILYSVVKSALNTLRAYDKADKNIPDEEIAEKFKQEFPDFAYCAFPQEMVRQKRLLRSGADVNICPKKTVEFLDALVKYIKNK